MSKKQTHAESKLFRLKEWLTVPDTAKHLSIIFGEEVGEADVLQLVLAGHLKLSVNFVNHANAKRGKIVGIENAKWIELPQKKDGTPMRGIVSINIDNKRFLNLNEKVISIKGVWDLCMLGNEQLDIEHEYQMLTGGPEVTLQGLDGAFVESEDGQICQLQERFSNVDPSRYSGKLSDFEKKVVAAGTITEDRLLKKKKERADRPYNHPDNFYPAGGLSSDSVLVVRTQALLDLQNRLSEEESKKNTKAFDPRSERTYLNIIGAFLEVVTGTFKDESFLSETQLRDFIAEKFDDLRGVSPRTLADKFALAKKALNGELD